MARLDASLTQGLMNPTYASELRNVGATAGMLGGQMRKERRAQEQAQKMAGMDAAGVLAEQRRIAKTPEEAVAAAKAQDTFVETRNARKAEALARAGKAAKPQVSALGIRYDRQMRTGDKEGAAKTMGLLEKVTEGTDLNVRDFIDTSREPVVSKAKRYDQVGDYMFDTETGQFLAPPSEEGGDPEQLDPKDLDKAITDNPEYYTEESMQLYKQGIANGESPRLAAKKLEAVDQEEVKNRRRMATVSNAKSNLMTVERLIELAPETGGERVATQIGSWVAGSDAMSIADAVDNIEANIAFDRLQRMRKESKTGGALGAVSQKELDFLRRSMATLNPASKDFKANLRRVQAAYESIISIEQGYTEGDPNYVIDESGRTLFVDPRTGDVYDANTFKQVTE